MKTAMHTWLRISVAALIGGSFGAVILPLLSVWVCHQSYEYLTKYLASPNFNNFIGPVSLWELWIGLHDEIPEITHFCNIWFGAILGATTVCGLALHKQQHFQTANQIIKAGAWLVLSLSVLIAIFVGDEFRAEGREPNGVLFVIAFPMLWAGFLLLLRFCLLRSQNE